MSGGARTAATAEVPQPFLRADLELHLFNAPIPRTDNWLYSISICDWDIVVNRSYVDAFAAVPVPAAFHIGPGEHDLFIKCTKTGTRGWRWQFPVVIAADADTYAIENAVCIDTIRLPARVSNRSRAVGDRLVKIEELYGVAEVLNLDGQQRSAVREGMTLRPGSVIVVGPRTQVIVESSHGDATDRVLLREANVLRTDDIAPGRLDDFELSPEVELRFQPHNSEQPSTVVRTAEELRHMDVDFGGPDWHACCSIRA